MCDQLNDLAATARGVKPKPYKEAWLDPDTLRALIEEARKHYTEGIVLWLRDKLDALPNNGEVHVDFGDSGLDIIEKLIDLAGKKVLEARAQHDDRNIRKWVAFVEWLQEQTGRGEMTKDQRIEELEARLWSCRKDRDAYKRRIAALERELAGERAFYESVYTAAESRLDEVKQERDALAAIIEPFHLAKSEGDWADACNGLGEWLYDGKLDPSAILAARLAAERKELIDRIAATIRDYPNVGGDTTIMTEVDKLVAAERKAGAVKALNTAAEYWSSGGEPIIAAYLGGKVMQIVRGEVEI